MMGEELSSVQKQKLKTSKNYYENRDSAQGRNSKEGTVFSKNVLIPSKVRKWVQRKKSRGLSSHLDLQ